MIVCSFSEMLSSWQDGLTKIQENSLHSVACPKELFRSLYDCSLMMQCNDNALGAGKI